MTAGLRASHDRGMADADEPVKALARTEQRSLAELGERAPDAYESEYMKGEGVTLYRDKSRAPWQLHALLGGSTAMVFAAAFLAGEAMLPMLAMVPVGLLVWLLFSVLRVSVSEGHVNVQYGLFGPKIPIPAIESAEATTYDWKRFGGWGIKRSLDGAWIYNMPGDGGRAVKIVWRNAKGKRKVTYVGSLQSEDLAAQIARARELRGALPAGAENRALGPGSDSSSD
ncbi:hypothetical protein PPSIR1_26753 [Plesiocystis pacifica SIR-1]|uniref:Uncharacterized protein n=2 Tax=Plesiocystis pacifica TaxID=191768 RepID=A6GAB6_9BACT|nr:hypothetical protein PPSIR1_26753 [Plesiocystis pacifica SIR-1]